jgi:hypothetical protein
MDLVVETIAVKLSLVDVDFDPVVVALSLSVSFMVPVMVAMLLLDAEIRSEMDSVSDTVLVSTFVKLLDT